mgnify:FL=1
MAKVTVTYIKHSGFLVETKESYLLFDYWEGKLPELQYDKELYVFSSHAHHDHYTKDIFKLENKCKKVVYVLSSDIKRASSFWKKAENVLFMKPHEEKVIDACAVSTLKSTDEGVAFLVKTEGKTIYHAGDLHWWDWPGEPEEDNKMMEQQYKEELESLKKESIDYAFVVLDPRQEESETLGIDYFIKNVGARFIFPMHCWEQYDIIERYKRNNDRKFLTGQIIDITGQEQQFISVEKTPTSFKW